MSLGRSKLFLISLLSLLFATLISFSILANQKEGFFSEKNFLALKKDPQALFSKTNSCHLKAMLGEKDFNSLKETMPLMTDEEDFPDFISISGNVRGLFTIMEGFFRMSKSGKVWIAYLQDDKLHYFTNDNLSLNQPPKIMQDWSKRFTTAKWISKPITFSDNQQC